METTIVDWGYIGVMENKMDTPPPPPPAQQGPMLSTETELMLTCPMPSVTGLQRLYGVESLGFLVYEANESSPQINH